MCRRPGTTFPTGSIAAITVILLAIPNCASHVTPGVPAGKTVDSASAPRPQVTEFPEQEARHLANVRQLTFAGEGHGKNGEAYFSRDGSRIVFQSVRGNSPYYQMYVMDDEGGGQRLLSTGRGKTTCGFFHPDGDRLIYASTHEDPRAFRPGVDAPPPPPDPRQRYMWDFDPSMEIFQADVDGRNLRRLTIADGYDAEGSYAHSGRFITFTSTRDGDGEIYVMDAAGAGPRRLTRAIGYDGGPFFSPGDDWIVFRGFRWGRDDRAEVFLVRPDGTGERQLTDLGVISWAPFFHPDGRRIVFAANLTGHNFDLVLVNLDGSGLERITYHPRFDGLPSFSADGRRILWTSNRADAGGPAGGRGESQIFVADWVDPAPASPP